MDKSGVIYKNGKQYALISELVQDDDITFSNNELKIITKKGCFIKFKEANKGSILEYRKKNYSSLSIMYALAKKEGLDGEKLFSMLRSVDIVNFYNKESKFKIDLEYSSDKIEEAGILNAFYSDAYSLVKVRDKMNKVLSIDRAVGKTLARPIKIGRAHV